MPNIAADSQQAIQNEAQAHIELGMLLRKSRSDELKARVESMLQEKTGVREKIIGIRRLDGDKDPGPKTVDKMATSRAQPLKFKTAMLQPVIKARLPRLGYFKYLFHQHRQIRELGLKEHLLRPVFFPPSVRLDPEALSNVMAQMQPICSELHELCDIALDLGWLCLEKRQYNLIVLLRRFCRSLDTTNFNLLDKGDCKLIDKIQLLEFYFFVLQYREDYVELTIAALQRALDNDSRYKGDSATIAVLITKALSRDMLHPSFWSLLLCLNMLKSRRYVIMRNLISTDIGDILNSEEFACVSRVRQKIDDYVEDSAKKILFLSDQYQDIEQFKRFLPTTGEGTIDYSPLTTFYEGAGRVANDYDFEIDRENVMLFAPRFLRMFDNTFFPLLCGKVAVSGVGRVVIFGKDCFPTEFGKIRHVIDALEKLTFGYHLFPYKRFIDIKRANKGAIRIELEIAETIDKAIDLLVGIGRRLESALNSPQRRIGQDEEPRPLDSSVFKGLAFNLPHETSSISSKDSLHGQKVFEALGFTVNICFLAAAYFYDQYTMELLQQGGTIQRQIRTRMEDVQRIANEETLSQIKEKVAALSSRARE